MTYGKEVCKTLKGIRQEIADKNEIKYSTEECHFDGECEGTCPKCESELKYLEKELRKRTQLGKAVSVAGISLGIASVFSTYSASAQNTFPSDSLLNAKDAKIVSDTIKTIVQQGESAIKGKVLDEEGKPLEFASVRLMQDEELVMGMTTNRHGEYFFTSVPSGIYDLIISISERYVRIFREIEIKSDEIKIIPDVIMIADLNMTSGIVPTRVVLGYSRPMKMIKITKEERKEVRKEKRECKKEIRNNEK